MFTNFTIHFLERNNEYSKNAIILKSNNVVLYIVGHLPEALAEKLFPLMKEWKLYKVTAMITGEKRRLPEGTWVLGSLGEVLNSPVYTYYLYGPKIHKCNMGGL